MSLIDFSRKPATPEWTSFNEPCGVGDGKTTRFRVPFPAAEARQLLVLRNLQIAAPDGETDRVLTEDGQSILVEAKPDGYRLAPDEEDPAALFIEFDRPVRLGTYVGVCCLGRQDVADAFQVLPLDKQLRAKLQKLSEKFKNRKLKDMTLDELLEQGRTSLQELVVGWNAKEDGQPVPCTAEKKNELLDQQELFAALNICNVMVDRARAIQLERSQARETDRGN